MLMQLNTSAGKLIKSVVTVNYGLERAINLMVIALSLRDQCLLADGVRTLRLKNQPNTYPNLLTFTAFSGGNIFLRLKN
jgi:hypothetical protein